VTASGSGLDPGISPQNAAIQVTGSRRRGTSARPPSRRWSASTPRAGPLGFLGEPQVNVLLLNIALDQKYPAGH
jgi:K+-transporting ATPase ATPase C chain